MKFMISQPMKDIPEKVIWNQREEIRKFLESKGHELIDTFFMDEAPEDITHPSVYYLGRAIMNGLCKADALILAPGWRDARGCIIEREIAYKYDIKVYEYVNNHMMYYPNWYSVNAVTPKPDSVE